MIEEYAPTIVYTLLVFIILLFALLIRTYTDNSNKMTVTDIQNISKANKMTVTNMQNIYKANQKRQRKEDKRVIKPSKLPIIGSVWVLNPKEDTLQDRIKIVEYIQDLKFNRKIRFTRLDTLGSTIVTLTDWDELDKELVR